jgi:hypothetical protein
MRDWTRSEIIGLITLVVAILACIANWIVVPGFRNFFMNRGFWVNSLPFVLPFIAVGLITTIIVRHYQDPHSTKSNSATSNDKEHDRVEPSINTVGTQLIYAGPDKIIIWTTIKLIDRSGKERYLKNLTADNFTITESFSEEMHRASIVKINSANVPVKAILVIDKSGSMTEPSGVIQSAKIEVAKNAVTFFFNQLTSPDKNYVAVLPFSGSKVEAKDFLRNKDGEIWLNNKSKTVLEKSVNGIKAGGNTPLWQAIDLSLDQFPIMNEETYKVIICLSDGIDNASSVTFESLLNKAKEKQIPIFTVGYGSEGQLKSQELIQLSSVSGAGRENAGSFIRVPPEDWSERLGSIGTGITNLYEVYWRPTGAIPGTRVTVQIDVTYELDGEILRTREQRYYVLP